MARPYKRKEPSQRFANLYLTNFQTECWDWISSVNPKGYGRFWLNGKPCQAHRFSYELHRGKIPDGLTLDHLCRNRKCVNPQHLECVTQGENLKRGFGFVGLAIRKTHCKHGHPFEGANLIIDKYGHRKCRTCVKRLRVIHKQRRAI